MENPKKIMTVEEQIPLRDQIRAARTEVVKGNIDRGEHLLRELMSECEARHERDALSEHVRAEVLLGIADIEQRRGKFELSLDHCYKACSIADEYQIRSVYARGLNSIGITHFTRAQYAEALDAWSRSLVILEELGEKIVSASIVSNIANVHLQRGKYGTALEYYNKALGVQEALGDKSGTALTLGNIGTVYKKLGRYETALDYLVKALTLHEELGEKYLIASVVGNIGNIHYELENYEKALEYYAIALSIHEELRNRSQVALVTGNIGNVYWGQGSYELALEYMGKAQAVFDNLGLQSDVARVTANIGNVHKARGSYGMALEFYGKGLTAHEELGEKSSVASVLGLIGSLYMTTEYEGYDTTQAEEYLLKSIELSESIGSKPNLVIVYKYLSELYENQRRWEEAHTLYKRYNELEKEINREEVKKEEAIREQQKSIELAKARADSEMRATTSLLHRVLPASIATRIIAGENDIADYFPQVSILFADIKGFTTISADMPAIIVVRFLKFVFGEFDRIISRHGCEKIKTIGDGYMAVAGAPIACDDHAERLASAAIEMQQPILLPDEIQEYIPTGMQFGVRIGLHTGSVVAGVIGDERFVYDIYSDAVNLASRMESHGEADKIHVTQDFVKHLQNRNAMSQKPSFFRFDKRGEMDIKGKGLMRTYFLEKNS